MTKKSIFQAVVLAGVFAVSPLLSVPAVAAPVSNVTLRGLVACGFPTHMFPHFLTTALIRQILLFLQCIYIIPKFHACQHCRYSVDLTQEETAKELKNGPEPTVEMREDNFGPATYDSMPQEKAF